MLKLSELIGELELGDELGDEPDDNNDETVEYFNSHKKFVQIMEPKKDARGSNCDHWQTTDGVHVGCTVSGARTSVAHTQDTPGIAPIKLRKFLNLADS